MGPMSEHVCHAVGCERRVDPKLLMCPRHWRMVPPEQQRAVWVHYRPGQERDKRPTLEYLRAAHAAVESVRRQERRAKAQATRPRPPEQGRLFP